MFTCLIIMAQMRRSALDPTMVLVDHQFSGIGAWAERYWPIRCHEQYGWVAWYGLAAYHNANVSTTELEFEG